MYARPFNINHVFIQDTVEFYTLDLKKLLSPSMSIQRVCIKEGRVHSFCSQRFFSYNLSPKDVFKKITNQPSLICFTYSDIPSFDEFAPYLTLVTSIERNPKGGEWFSFDFDFDHRFMQFKITNSSVLLYRDGTTYGWKVLIKGSLNKIYSVLENRTKGKTLYQVNTYEIRKLK